ncbi:MAG: hypothetical protein OEV59_06295 [Deltaproteobacteria bacterium]|nr:hypothetical protein [Deltaproteobacteria bacterium]
MNLWRELVCAGPLQKAFALIAAAATCVVLLMAGPESFAEEGRKSKRSKYAITADKLPGAVIKILDAKYTGWEAQPVDKYIIGDMHNAGRELYDTNVLRADFDGDNKNDDYAILIRISGRQGGKLLAFIRNKNAVYEEHELAGGGGDFIHVYPKNKEFDYLAPDKPGGEWTHVARMVLNVDAIGSEVYERAVGVHYYTDGKFEAETTGD